MNNNYIIYKAQNNFTGEAYIGATTKSIEERKVDHIKKSSKGFGSYFQEAIGTYGTEAFSWEQIDTANDINEMAEMEKNYILEYDSRTNGYNSDCGGGIKKNIYQYDMEDCSLLNTYDSLESAACAIKASRKSISNVCLGYNSSCRGFYWSYTFSEPFVPDVDKRTKEVFQYTVTGDLLAHYKSVAEASRIAGISKTCISRCCRGEREQTGGFLWKYI